MKEKDVILFLEEYCKTYGINEAKAKSQLVAVGNNVSMLCVKNPDAPKPDGLSNDIDTQMLVTLYIKSKNGILYAEETEYTNQYLKN